MLSELDKLIGCFYVGKFCEDADCYIQDSHRMDLKNAKKLVKSKRSNNKDGEYTILGVVDY